MPDKDRTQAMKELAVCLIFGVLLAVWAFTGWWDPRLYVLRDLFKYVNLISGLLMPVVAVALGVLVVKHRE